jgi:AcrR family transcriptional regulator
MDYADLVTRTARPLDDERAAGLFLVAAQAFLAFGFEGASLNRIIADAGWSKSSFYHYFHDKQELYDHLLAKLRSHYASQTALMDPQTLTRETFWEQFDRTLRGLGAAPVADPLTLALARLLHDQRQVDPGLRALRADLFHGLARVLRRGQELGAVRTDLPADLVGELAAAWLFALDRWAAEHRASADASGNGLAADTALAAGLGLQALHDVLAVH